MIAESPSSQTVNREDLSRAAIAMYMNSAQGVATQSAELHRSAVRVSRLLTTVAVMQSLNALVAWVASGSKLFPSGPSEAEAIGWTAMAVVFWGLCIWSRRAPLAPSIAGLVLYLGVWAARSMFHLMQIGQSATLPPDKQILQDRILGAIVVVRTLTALTFVPAIVAGYSFDGCVGRAQ